MVTGRRAARASRRRRALAAALAAAGVALLPGTAAAAAGEEGKAVFDRLCSACHTLGGGDRTGPDLDGLADRRDRDWVERFVFAPDEVIASGDPTAAALVEQYGVPMPDVGVTDAQIGPLLEYLGFAAAPPPPATTAPDPVPPPATTAPEPPAAAAGDPDRGKRLFEGSDRLEAGGPSCLSCHSVAGVGALGGGRLGPDLTGALEKYGGAQGLRAALEAVPFPTMAPIFSGRPLAEDELDDLVAFLEEAPEAERPAGSAGKLVGLSAGSAAALALVAAVVWRRRLGGVRRPLVDRSKGR